jgi:4-hydroxy-tetrahydrodipicolinate reductase
MKTRVCVAGATGWMGQALSKAITETNDLDLVAAVSRKRAREKLQSTDVVISQTVQEALANTPVDVLVDYTLPDAVKVHTLLAIEKRVPVVIGTSGLTDQDYEEIGKAAEQNEVGVIACGNFSITAALLERFACEAAKFLKQWEIIDYASATKPDAPSGVARELSYLLSKIRKPEISHPIARTEGVREARGATINETQIHSLRLPSYVIALEIIFGAKDERLTIRHDAGEGASPYLAGTLLAIRKVRNHKGLIRGLGNILFDDGASDISS